MDGWPDERSRSVIRGKAISEVQRRERLRLVVDNSVLSFHERFQDPVFQREFQQLTERLIDVMIEMMDIIDGDPDVEANGDEFEDAEGI